MKTFRMRDTLCLLCGYHIDHASDAGLKKDKERQPKPGDLSICLNCGALTEFGDDMSSRPVGVSIDNIDLAPELRHRIKVAVAAIKKRGPLKGARRHMT